MDHRMDNGTAVLFKRDVSEESSMKPVKLL
jgi:hypothetical protein